MSDDILYSLRARRAESEEGFFGTCDFTSYCYFSLAVVLFTVGTVVTVFALDDGAAPLFGNLGHMWLVGPIFISSGLMVAVKTVLYLRKKNLITLILRQRAMFRDLQAGSHVPISVARNPSTITLPPSYDSAVGQMIPAVYNSNSDGGPVRLQVPGPLSCRTLDSEAPPPSYEEAMLLVSREHDQTVSQPIEEVDSSNRQVAKDAEV